MVARGGTIRLTIDDRGLSPVLGALLVLGIVVLAWGIYHSTVVPDMNETAEIDHSQRVQNDLEALQSTVSEARASGARQPAAVQLGLEYPDRALALEPPAATGRVSTSDAQSIAIANAQAIAPEAQDFWDGSAISYSTRLARYQVDYVRHQSPPTVRMEHSMVVSQYGADSVIRSWIASRTNS